MAGGVNHSSRVGSKRRRRFSPTTEINVTPLVDVMLVLLIIFMVTAPMLTVGVPVSLPKTDATKMNDSEDPLVITVDKDGKVFLQESEINFEQIVPRLMAISGVNADMKIYVRGDEQLPYGKVMQTMGLLSKAGFKKVALIAEMPGGGQ